MLYTIEFILKVLFFILSFVWISKIMTLRSDKQIVINPLLIGIGAIIAVLPDNTYIELFGIGIQGLKALLYLIYILVILFGLYSLNRKDGVF
jgi:hypothetical protein